MEEHVVYPNYVLDDSFLWQIENVSKDVSASGAEIYSSVDILFL